MVIICHFIRRDIAEDLHLRTVTYSCFANFVTCWLSPIQTLAYWKAKSYKGFSFCLVIMIRNRVFDDYDQKRSIWWLWSETECLPEIIDKSLWGKDKWNDRELEKFHEKHLHLHPSLNSVRHFSKVEWWSAKRVACREEKKHAAVLSKYFGER